MVFIYKGHDHFGSLDLFLINHKCVHFSSLHLPYDGRFGQKIDVVSVVSSLTVFQSKFLPPHLCPQSNSYVICSGFMSGTL